MRLMWSIAILLILAAPLIFPLVAIHVSAAADVATLINQTFVAFGASPANDNGGWVSVAVGSASTDESGGITVNDYPLELGKWSYSGCWSTITAGLVVERNGRTVTYYPSDYAPPLEAGDKLVGMLTTHSGGGSCSGGGYLYYVIDASVSVSFSYQGILIDLNAMLYPSQSSLASISNITFYVAVGSTGDFPYVVLDSSAYPYSVGGILADYSTGSGTMGGVGWGYRGVQGRMPGTMYYVGVAMSYDLAAKNDLLGNGDYKAVQDAYTAVFHLRIFVGWETGNMDIIHFSSLPVGSGVAGLAAWEAPGRPLFSNHTWWAMYGGENKTSTGNWIQFVDQGEGSMLCGWGGVSRSRWVSGGGTYYCYFFNETPRSIVISTSGLSNYQRVIYRLYSTEVWDYVDEVPAWNTSVSLVAKDCTTYKLYVQLVTVDGRVLNYFLGEVSACGGDSQYDVHLPTPPPAETSYNITTTQADWEGWGSLEQPPGLWNATGMPPLPDWLSSHAGAALVGLVVFVLMLANQATAPVFALAGAGVLGAGAAAGWVNIPDMLLGLAFTLAGLGLVSMRKSA